MYQLKFELFIQTLVLLWPSIYVRIIHLRFSESCQFCLKTVKIWIMAIKNAKKVAIISQFSSVAFLLCEREFSFDFVQRSKSSPQNWPNMLNLNIKIWYFYLNSMFPSIFLNFGHENAAESVLRKGLKFPILIIMPRFCWQRLDFPALFCANRDFRRNGW